MQQVKIFKSLETDVLALEREINAWIRDTGAKVISISGNIAPQSGGPSLGGSSSSDYPTPSDILLVVLYQAG